MMPTLSTTPGDGNALGQNVYFLPQTAQPVTGATQTAQPGAIVAHPKKKKTPVIPITAVPPAPPSTISSPPIVLASPPVVTTTTTPPAVTTPIAISTPGIPLSLPDFQLPQMPQLPSGIPTWVYWAGAAAILWMMFGGKK